MKKITILLASLALATTMAFAQSSGSFNYNIAQTACTDTSGLLGTGVSVPALKTTMKGSSGNGNGLHASPSAVLGLLTRLTANPKNSTGSSQAGLKCNVNVTPLRGQSDADHAPTFPVT